MSIRKLVSKAVSGTVGAYVGKAGEISFDPTLGAFKLSDGVTPGGIAITEPTAINVADNRWYVDPSRTDINPAAQATNRAINGVAGNVVLYTGPVFQYGTCDKISTAITLIALDTTFTAV